LSTYVSYLANLEAVVHLNQNSKFHDPPKI